MRKLLIGLFATLLTIPAHAGFITGFVVGSAMSSGGGSAAPASGGASTLIASHHDTIVCRQETPGRCSEAINCPGPTCVLHPTPGQMAAFAGYKFLHQTAIVITPEGRVYIVMEVSK